MSLSYTFASFLLLYMVKQLSYELSGNTVLVLVFGLLWFVFLYNLSYNFFGKYRFSINLIRKSRSGGLLEQQPSYIEVNYLNYGILLLANGIILIIYILFYIRAVGGFSLSQISEIVHYYHSETAYGEGLDNAIPSIVSQLTKINWVTTYISTYIFTHNFILSRKNGEKKTELRYLIPIFLYLPISILAGSRANVLYYITYFILLWVIIDKYYSKRGNIKFGTMVRILLIVIVVIVAFSNLRTLVGRVNESGIYEYIAMYFGAPIINFDQYLNHMAQDNYALFGREIFRGVYSFLEQSGVINNLEELSRTFVTIRGTSTGNVYTAYKYMYTAAGYTGIIIFQGLYGMIFGYLTTRLRDISEFDRINGRVILYCAIIHVIIFHPFSELFFSTVISFNYFAFILLFLVLRYFLIKVKI